MSQNDFNVANQTFPNTRVDLNGAFQALASMSGGASAPSTTYASQTWHDTTNDLMKIRNKANSAWITVAKFDTSNDRWEIRSNIIQAVSTAGITLKNSSGTTIFSISDAGVITINDDSIALNKVVKATDTGRGSVELSTTAEGDTGTDQERVAPVSVVKSMIEKHQMEVFQSSLSAANSGVFMQFDLAAGVDEHIFNMRGLRGDSSVTGYNVRCQFSDDNFATSFTMFTASVADGIVTTSTVLDYLQLSAFVVKSTHPGVSGELKLFTPAGRASSGYFLGASSASVTPTAMHATLKPSGASEVISSVRFYVNTSTFSFEALTDGIDYTTRKYT